MKRLERYLNEATRGLFGRRKKAVQLELRGDIEDKLHRYQIVGLSEEQALERTLQDLGSARALRGGFFRLHSAPLLGQLGALVLASSAAVLALWPSNSAQVVATQAQIRGYSCEKVANIETVNKSNPAMRRLWEMWLQRKDGTLDIAKGLRACKDEQQTYQYLNLNMLEQVWKTLGANLRKGENDGKYVRFPGASEDTFIAPSVNRNGQAYAALRNLGFTLTLGDLPVQVSGEVNPVIFVGNNRFQIGTSATPILSSHIYSAILDAAQWNRKVFAEMYVSDKPEDSINLITGVTDKSARDLNFAAFRVPVREGAVVVLMYQGDAKTRFFQATQVRGGVARLFITPPYARAFPAAATWDQLKKATLERPQWLLLDLSKTTDWRKPQYSIIAPSSIKLE